MPHSKALKRIPKPRPESWHQAISKPSTVSHDPKRYDWGDVEAMFGDQVKVVAFKPGQDASKKKTQFKAKGKMCLRSGKTKIKRLGNAKTGEKRQKPKLSFTLSKRLLQKIIIKQKQKKRLLRRSSE